jgi:hypothetical protein
MLRDTILEICQNYKDLTLTLSAKELIGLAMKFEDSIVNRSKNLLEFGVFLKGLLISVKTR